VKQNSKQLLGIVQKVSNSKCISCNFIWTRWSNKHEKVK